MRGHPPRLASGRRGQSDISAINERNFIPANVRETQQPPFLRFLAKSDCGAQHNHQGSKTASE